VVEIPSCCIHWDEGMGECNVVKNGWRERSTGPCHPLRRVKCRHGPGYTLYPPGHYPRGRMPVAPVSSAGEIVRVAQREDTGDDRKAVGKPAWYITVFAAALDACQGIGWFRESPADDCRRRRTQRRYIEMVALLLGLSYEMDEAVSQRIAGCLGIAWLCLSDQRRVYQSAQTYHTRGAAIAAVLEMIPVDRSLSHRLLMAGFIAGLWGRPRRWDPG
jgi:hypothetical protein